ncbi:MAG: PorT family protein [Sphingobacteriales bacterium]|nr:MAG: PorT family protein [Sphingobacteriales bacterium]
MKKIYTLLALALVSGSVMAQSNDGVKFGVRAGVNLASFALSGSEYDSPEGKLEKDNQKSTTSFSFGGYVEIPVSEKFSVQPGLNLSGKGGKVEYSENVLGGNLTITGKASTMYIELPVNAVFNFGGFYVGAGPYVGYAIAGRTKSETKFNGVIVPEGSQPERDIKFGSKKDTEMVKGDDYKPLDFGLNGLVGYKLESGLNFGVNYGFGLANLDPEGNSNSKASNRVFSVLVGFSF